MHQQTRCARHGQLTCERPRRNRQRIGSSGRHLGTCNTSRLVSTNTTLGKLAHRNTQCSSHAGLTHEGGGELGYVRGHARKQTHTHMCVWHTLTHRQSQQTDRKTCTRGNKGTHATTQHAYTTHGRRGGASGLGLSALVGGWLWDDLLLQNIQPQAATPTYFGDIINIHGQKKTHCRSRAALQVVT